MLYCNGVGIAEEAGGATNLLFLSENRFYDYFNPWANFQTFRHLTPPVLLGRFQHNTVL